MKALRLLLALTALVALATSGRSGPLTEADRTFLGHYEAIRAALAADDLPAVQTAARAVPEAQPVAAADSLSAARKAFKELSTKAVALARGQPGYYVAHCPMFLGGADWIQTTEEIANPYWGQSMLHCGKIVK